MSGILQLVNTFGPSGPFAVKNSLRLRSSASAYLSRTITLSATWTLSVWVKRGSLGVTSPIFGASVLFNSNDTLTAGTLTTTSVYRDPSAWYHIVVSNSGCYVNGVSVGSTATGILVSPLIGSNAINYFDGYLAELNLVDGQALTPSSFGAFDSTSGVWQPTRYSGTYGTNGFYLKFSDTTSTTTLCYDYSGNSNNWTPNNISLTAGSTYDSMLDSPTNYDNGGNGVGNYAVLNPLSNLYGSTLSNANLTAYCSTIQSGASGTIRLNSGSWYFEETIQATGSPGRNWVGFMDDSYIADNNGFSYTSKTLLYASDGSGGITGGAYGASYTTGDVIGVAFNIDTGTIAFYKNGASQGNLTTGASGVNWRPFVSFGATGWQGAMNFGQRPFAYTPPTGYKALNTQNLPAPSIQNGASYMAATLWTGDGASPKSFVNVVNGVSFQPDLVWIKMRSGAYQHVIADSVRGGNAILHSNSTSAEDVNWQYGYLQSFNSDGFTAQAGSTSIENINLNGSTYVGWQWKAGGTAVTNTAGSITSSVSANTTAGFSVVTYTGTLTTTGNVTIGHGLGVAPAFIIGKSRNVTGADGGTWNVWHVSLGADYFMRLQTTDTPVNTVSTGGGSRPVPTSSIFYQTYNSGGAITGNNYVAYCFAAIPGYSAFGSYTGNGSTDGPFVFLGFRPRWIMFKRTDSASDWVILDTSRNTYNVMNATLWADLSSAEGSYTWCDYLSNGFKFRDASNGLNNSGGTYIYAAFAENPLKYSLAR